MMTPRPLYDHVGYETMTMIMNQFYDLAFEDPIIGHFFFGRNKKDLIDKQILFTTQLLGGPLRYKGPSLPQIHLPLKIRKPHFLRRQILLKEVLNASDLPQELIRQWFKIEEVLEFVITIPS